MNRQMNIMNRFNTLNLRVRESENLWREVKDIMKTKAEKKIFTIFERVKDHMDFWNVLP